MRFWKNILPEFTIPATFDSLFSYEEQIGYLITSYNNLVKEIADTFDEIRKEIPEIVHEEVAKEMEQVLAALNEVRHKLTQLEEWRDRTIPVIAQNKADIKDLREELEALTGTVTENLTDVMGEINRLEQLIEEAEARADRYSDEQNDLLEKRLNDKLNKQTGKWDRKFEELMKLIEELPQLMFPDVFNIFTQKEEPLEKVLVDYYKFLRSGSTTSKELADLGMTAGELNDLDLTAYSFDVYARWFLLHLKEKKEDLMMFSPVDGKKKQIRDVICDLFDCINENGMTPVEADNRTYDAELEESDLTVLDEVTAYTFTTSHDLKNVPEGTQCDKYYNDHYNIFGWEWVDFPHKQGTEILNPTITIPCAGVYEVTFRNDDGSIFIENLHLIGIPESRPLWHVFCTNQGVPYAMKRDLTIDGIAEDGSFDLHFGNCFSFVGGKPVVNPDSNDGYWNTYLVPRRILLIEKNSYLSNTYVDKTSKL